MTSDRSTSASGSKPKPAFIPIHEALSKRSRPRFLGLTVDDAIKYFFGGNAALSIVVLFLIMAMLLLEGGDFIPLNYFNLSIYRKAGLEYVDYLRAQVDGHVEQGRVLQTIRERALPFISTHADISSATTAIGHMQVKTEVGDRDKIGAIQTLIHDHVNVNRLVELVRTSADFSQLRLGV